MLDEQQAVIVPARVGGVDLSGSARFRSRVIMVPARVGGVDLSYVPELASVTRYGPRPCGRGGFKHLSYPLRKLSVVSPPVWAGWI